MDVVGGARRVVVRTADAATATAGAVSGAVVNGAFGAIEGAATGVVNGVKRGGNSSVAAAVTIVTIGAVGLVEWPIVAGIGGAALLIHQLGQRGSQQRGNQQRDSQAGRSKGAPAAAPRQRAKPAKRAPQAGRS